MPTLSYREAMGKVLREALDNDPKVFLMGEDVGRYGGPYAVTAGFQAIYGEDRVRDTPISESGFVGCGIGAAMAGMRPVVELMISAFSLLALDQIVNNAAKLHYMSAGQITVPVVIRMVNAVGSQAGAPHSVSVESWLASVPGLKVVCPATPRDAVGLFRSAIKDKNPVIFVEHALLYKSEGEVPDQHYEIPLGQAEVKRQGDDVTIVAYLRMVPVALDAAEQLASQGVQCEVVDLRSLSPLDIDTVVSSAKKTGRCIIVEETNRTGAFGAEVAAQVYSRAFDSLDGEIVRVAGADVPTPFARHLELASVPSQEDVVTAVQSILQG